MLLLFLLVPLVSTFSPIVLQQPIGCAEPTPLLVLVHSSPAHRGLRQTLRETWARNRAGHIRTVFVVGDPKNKKLTEALIQEGKEQGDLLQASHCNTVSWILKTDDDQFVDTLHLPQLLNELRIAPEDQLFLCQILRRGPERDPRSKWYVSEEEYPSSSYPPYCAGWAYLTTLPTIQALLKAAPSLPQLWIDDLFVSGLVAATLDPPVQFYDWSYSFLNYHTHMKAAVLTGDFYTPELMVCGDVVEAEIRHVWKKAEFCAKRNCYSLLYGNIEARKDFMPTKQIDILSKEEL